jgi:hypothetical protein
LTRTWGLPKDRLWVTVFGGDDKDGLPADVEAERVWREETDIDPSHILRFGRKDNFWEMGETGPCGPLHRTPTRGRRDHEEGNANNPDSDLRFCERGSGSRLVRFRQLRLRVVQHPPSSIVPVLPKSSFSRASRSIRKSQERISSLPATPTLIFLFMYRVNSIST